MIADRVRVCSKCVNVSFFLIQVFCWRSFWVLLICKTKIENMERIHIRGMGGAFGGGSDRMERKKNEKL